MRNRLSLYAKFFGPEIFLEQGRLLFAVLHAFHRGGYSLELHPYLGEKELDKYGQLIYSLNNLQLSEKPHCTPETSLYIYDRPDPRLAKHSWRKRLQIRFDLFAPFWRSDPIIMPFPMHPMQFRISHAELSSYREIERKFRVFFSGDTEHYRRVWVRYPKIKMPREPIVQAVMQRMGQSLLIIDDVTRLADIFAGDYVNKCVLTASSQVRIEFADWLPTLAHADFFLSPPGIVMPMCHNIIEAMAVGTIPITNYPEWLDPPLRAGVNCLTFDDSDNLIAVLNQALAMSREQIEAMRAGVLNYYERYLRPERFLDRVEAHPGPEIPVLMYTERNMALNPKRLGRHSILMQGTAQPRPHGLLRRLSSVYLKRDTVRG